MTKLSIALTTAAALVSSASAFAPSKDVRPVTSALSATGFEEVGGKPWDPLSLGKLEDANDTFPNMFPKSQYLQESEIKHGRMSMLAWTGVWATHVVSFNLQAFPLMCSLVYYFFKQQGFNSQSILFSFSFVFFFVTGWNGTWNAYSGNACRV